MFHNIQYNWQYYGLYILIFNFLERNREEESVNTKKYVFPPMGRFQLEYRKLILEESVFTKYNINFLL